MAFMNKAERDALLEELKPRTFNQIKPRVRRLDPKVRLAYFRNVQQTNKWMTRYILPTRGIQVTLVEGYRTDGQRSDFELQEIIIEPTADNRL